MKHLFRFILSMVAAAAVFSCGGSQDKAPDTSYAQYIDGFTGGVIAEGKPIRVILNSDIIASAEDQLFKFSPAIKGTQRFSDSKTAEFWPEEGALVQGTTYTCTFDLAKAAGVKEKGLKEFRFNVFAPVKVASVSVYETNISKEKPDVACIKGKIELNATDPGEIAVLAGGKQGVVTKESDYIYTFVIDGIERTDDDKTIQVTATLGNGFKTPAPENVFIPGKASFKIVDAVAMEGDTPYIMVTFSKPLKSVPVGLATVRWAGRTYTSQNGNILKVYYENFYEDELYLQIDGNIKSTDGASLGEDIEMKVETAESKPAVKIALDGNIVPNADKILLPFKAINLKAVDIKIIKIFANNVLSFLQENSLNGSSNLRRSGRLVYEKTIALDQDPELDLHKWQDFSVDLSGLIKQEQGAIYRIRLFFKKEYSLYGKTASEGSQITYIPKEQPSAEELAVWDVPYPYMWDSYIDWDDYNWSDRDNPDTPSYYMVEGRFPVINLIASEIGLLAKRSEVGKLWVAASNLITAEPASGTAIDVYNYQLQNIGSGKTSSDGLAEIKISGVPFVICAKQGKSVSYLVVKDGEQNSLSRFDVGGRKLEKGLKAYIFGERGVWRPGDTLHLTMLLQDKGSNLPEKHPVTIELYTPEGQFYAKEVNTSGLDGFYRFDIPTAAEDPTGIWNAVFKAGGCIFNKSVRVETIKPNRLKINTSFSTDVLSAGENTTVNVASNWLTGPAASGLKAKVEMSLTKAGSWFEGYEGYTFNDPLKDYSPETYSLLDTRLDQTGKTAASIQVPKAYEAPGMLKAYIISSVTENGGDESITSMTIPFSPYSSYVGIKPPKADNGYLETGKDLVFDIVSVNNKGKAVPGKNLEYKIYKLKWSWWWDSKASDLYSYVNSSSAKVISSGTIVSGSKPSNITMRIEYPDWGRYLVYVKDLSSGHAAGVTVLVDWPSYLGRSAKQDPDALSMLTFSLDKKSYTVGETATVYIPATGGKGNALVSLENASGIISSKWVSVSGKEDTSYKIKITDEMAPNFYVHITLVQPHGNAGNDLPIRLFGVQPVLVDRPESVLHPVITMADSVHPEEKFNVSVSEKSGKQMTYTIAIVDEGLLDITSFKTPDPWNYMYSREALGVDTWDLYDQVAGAVSGSFRQMLSVGGDEQIKLGGKKDNRFNPIVKVMGPFTLKSGTAKHTVQLPMYVGSVRVMVVAAHDGAYGNAEKTVTVKSPLMAVTTLPRVLGEEEEVVVPVNVFALEDGIGDVSVNIKVDGAATLVGNGTNSLSFSAPGDKITEFKIKGKGQGIAKVTVTATSAGHKSQETINLPVQNPNRPVTNVTYKTIPANGSVTLSLSDKWQEGTLLLTGFPSIDYAGAFNYVKAYPYSCSEQLSSRGLILLHSLDKLPESKVAEAKELLNNIIKQLYGRQLADGGFAYWSGNTMANQWVTSMAGLLMSEAKAKGFDVSKQVLSSWLSYQKTAVRNYRKSSGEFLVDLDQAFRLYSMAVAGEEDNSSMNRLKESETLTPQARWMLASAYAVCGKKQIAESIIDGIEQGFVEYSTANRTFGSSYRDKAIATEALTLAGRTGEAIRLAQQLANLFGPGYSSTQESAFAAIALDRLSAVAGHETIQAKVKGAGAEQSYDTNAGSVSYEFKKGDKEIMVNNLSGSPLYAAISETVQPGPREYVPAKSSGIKLEVSYTTDNGNSINPASIKQGTEFTATVTVTNVSLAEDYTNLALKEAVPSGWEIFNERLYGAPVAAANAFDNLDIRDDGVIWYFDLARGTSKTFTVRLRAAYRGKFVQPSITCEMMYNALVSACTSSWTADVTE